MEKKARINPDIEVVSIDPETDELRARNIAAANELAKQLGLTPEDLKKIKGLSRNLPMSQTTSETAVPVDPPPSSKRRRVQ